MRQTELIKVTIRLTSAQLHKLRVLYPNMGYNAVIRALVADHLAKRMSSLTEGIIHEQDPVSKPLSDSAPSSPEVPNGRED